MCVKSDDALVKAWDSSSVVSILALNLWTLVQSLVPTCYVEVSSWPGGPFTSLRGPYLFARPFLGKSDVKLRSVDHSFVSMLINSKR